VDVVTTNTALGFATNNLERMRVTNGGDVGIGESARRRSRSGLRGRCT